MTFEEYRTKTIEYLRENLKGVSNEDFNKYINDDETVDMIRSDYMSCREDNLAQVSPASTAYCLFMLY